MKKYNFEEMQIEFLKWDWDTIESYISFKWVTKNWFVTKKMRWRIETKQKIKEQAIEESKKKIQESMVITNDELIAMKKTTFNLIKARLNQLIKKSVDNQELPTKEFTDIIKTLKVELKEPTSYINQEITWKDWSDLLQWITVQIVK